MFFEPETVHAFEFDNLIRFTIDQDGTWKVTDATHRDYFPRDWAEVWARRTIDIGFAAFTVKAKENNPTRAMFVRQMADYILAQEWWDPKDHTWIITLA
jgi:hypothetical protein